MTTRVLPVILALALAGCATQPEQIKGTYVSPSTYSNHTCAEINAERQDIAAKVEEVAGEQKKKASGDAVAMGVGLVIFWPALFLLAAGEDKKAELAALKGNYDAMTQAGIKKKCFTA